MKYFIQTYGCAMNTTDSERVASVLERLGYEKAPKKEEADLLIFNTCSVRQKAEDRVYGLRKMLAKLRKKNEKLLVGITGCMVRKTSTKNTEAKKDKVLHTMPEMDIAFRIEDVAQLPELIQELDPSITFEDQIDEGTLENYFKIAPKKVSNYSVFVPVMTGCDKFCTYCIVPYTRGREYSRDYEEILSECEKHVNEGAIEITLVGQTVNTYGLSFQDKKSGKFERFEGSPFAQLLRDVDKLKDKGLKRLRFTSPHPRDFRDDVIDAIAECETLCPYIHMPVQSGDDAVLRRMNRNYKMDEYMRIMNKIREKVPNIAISTDIIVGFCGETEEEFQNTLDMYREMEWDWCYLARYSPRKGTYSEKKMADDVSPKVKAERWHRLNEVMVKIAAEKHQAFIGKDVEVLVTEQIGETCRGRSPEFKEVQFKSGRQLLGQIVPVHITGAREVQLQGELL
jgi:tRNA-2-methylthio-N6-dimethylallyladenosine synthase